MQFFKSTRAFILLGLLICILIGGFVGSVAFAEGHISLPFGEIFAARENVIVHEEHAGDVFAYGDSIEIKANVDGDVVLIGEKVQIDAEISGSAIVLAQEIIVNGVVQRNAYLAGTTVEMNENSVISKRLYIAGQDVTVAGNMENRSYIRALDAQLNAQFNDSVYIYASDYSLGEGAAVNGNLTVFSENHIDISADRVQGEIKYENLPTQSEEVYSWFLFPVFKPILFVSTLFTWFALGYVLIYLWPHTLRKRSEEMQKHIPKAFLFGVLWYIVVPLLMLVFLISIIGIPIAVILGLLLIIGVILSKVLFSIFLGNWILQLPQVRQHINKSKSEEISMVGILGVGVFTYTLCTYIPFISFATHVCSIVLGTALFMNCIRTSFNVSKEK